MSIFYTQFPKNINIFLRLRGRFEVYLSVIKKSTETNMNSDILCKSSEDHMFNEHCS